MGKPLPPGSNAPQETAPEEEESSGPSLIQYLQARSAGQSKLKAKSLDLGRVKRILLEGGKGTMLKQTEDAFGYTPLAFACSLGHDHLVKVFIDAGADVNVQCNLGNGPLHLAARGGHLGIVQLLLTRSGLMIDARNAEGWTPLIWGAMSGHADVVEALLAATAEAAAQDNNGFTALMWATRHGYVGIMRLFLALGPDLGIEDYSGHDVIHHAREHRAARKMLARFEDVNRKLMSSAQTGDMMELTRALEAGAAVNTVDSDGTSPLLWAASNRNMPMVRLLVSRGADPSFEAGSSNYAWLQSSQLRSQSAAIHEVLRDAVKANRLLLASAKEGDWSRASKALEHGAWVEIPDESQKTPLSWAASHGSVEGTRELLKAQASVNAKDVCGWTPLHWAAHYDRAEAASVLHHGGADVLTRTFTGDTPQHLAAKSNSCLMLMLLRAAGADLESQDLEAHTPLQVACIRGNVAAMESLLSLKADAAVRDASGRSIVALAATHGQNALLQRLLPEDVGASQDGDTSQVLSKVSSKLGQLKAGKGATSSRTSKKSSKGLGKSQKLLTVPLKGSRRGSQKGSQVGSRSASRASSPASSEASSRASSRGSPRTKQKKKPTRTKNRSSVSHSGSQSPKGARLPVRGGDGDVSDDAYNTMHSARSDRSACSTGSFGRSRAKKSAEPLAEDLELFSQARGLSKKLPRAAAISSSEVLAEGDSDGRRPLALAAQAGQHQTVALLLAKKADIDTADGQGNTALMLTVACGLHGSAFLVELLLAAKADAEVRNNDGLRAVDITKDQAVRDALRRHTVRIQVGRKLKAQQPSAPLPEESASAAGSPGQHPVFGLHAKSNSRVRLESLPRNIPADILEDGIRILLRQKNAPSPSKIEVPVHPITQVSIGHAYVDYEDDGKADMLANHQQFQCTKRGPLRGTVKVLRECVSLPALPTATR